MLAFVALHCSGAIEVPSRHDVRLAERPRLARAPTTATAPFLLAMTTGTPSASSQLLVFPVTCFWFFFEALVHFHIGKTGALGISLPKNDELFKIVVSILLCSALSSWTVTLIENLIARRRSD